MLKNKKGIATSPIFLTIFIVFFIAIFLGITVWLFSYFGSFFDIDVQVGEVNLTQANNQTLGRLTQAGIDNADTLGIIILFGMIITMILNAYFFGSRLPKLFMIIDVFILIFAFILSVYISQIYKIYIDVDIVNSIYVDNIPKVSKFILNLPIIVTVVGIVIMILSYSGLNRKNDQIGSEANVLGY